MNIYLIPPKKNIYNMQKLLLISLFISSITNAQVNFTINEISSQEISQVQNEPKTTFKTKSLKDTLTYNAFFTYGTPVIFSYNPYGYVFGTCWDSTGTLYAQGISQSYFYTGTPFVVEEALIWVGKKTKKSVNGSSLIVNLRKMDSSSTIMSQTWPCPGTTLRSVTIPWNNIDTSTQFTKAIFTNPPGIFDDFAIHLSFTDFYANNDTIGIVCGGQGSGSGISMKDNTMFRFFWKLTGKYYWAPISFLYSNLDVAIAIWPVVDKTTGGIDGKYFVNGIKLGQNFPNPVNNITIIDYEIEKDSDIIIEVLDSNGKIVKQISEGKKTAGKYSVSIDIAELSSGLYYYSLKTDNNRLTKKMMVQ